uniref:histidine kinase n=1 Tax=uncultured Chloroflexota bacterium TaxID=166587 RepID=H5S9A7_9CHLR|nr:histidine kinase [uncultured Chloroflexota bacterium]
MKRLETRIFFSHLLVIGLAALVLILASQASLPNAFERHMRKAGYGMMSGGMGTMIPMLQLYREYRNSFNEALFLALLAAVVLSILVSGWLSMRIVSPLQELTRASQRIAQGHYGERVQVDGDDEIAELAHHFNSMAEQLEQVEARRRQLIADVSHELRTPLTTIKGYMEGLIDGILPSTAETFHQVYQEADRLSRLVDDLQELSRVEAGAIALQFRPVAIAQVAATVRKRLGPQIEAQGLSLEVNVPADLPPVRADEDRLIQVLTNLVGNAIKFTPSGGRIAIEAEKRGNEVYLSVQDTGIGIPAEHLPYIFDRFYRVERSRSRSTGGSGIGLTIARHLIEAHGGRIWAESKGEGKGSRFTIALPISRS